MLGYYRDEAQTRAAFRDGWFLTGDLAWRDADGYFWFVARKRDIIRKRGENISGAELDRVIGSHPAVLEAAAIPVPSELGEDEILVAVVLFLIWRLPPGLIQWVAFASTLPMPGHAKIASTTMAPPSICPIWMPSTVNRSMGSTSAAISVCRLTMV